MNSKVTGDMVPLGTRCPAVLPPASETKVVGALATDMVVTEMVVEGLWIYEGLGAVLPVTPMGR
jgi:hypothetical protein